MSRKSVLCQLGTAAAPTIAGAATAVADAAAAAIAAGATSVALEGQRDAWAFHCGKRVLLQHQWQRQQQWEGGRMSKRTQEFNRAAEQLQAAE